MLSDDDAAFALGRQAVRLSAPPAEWLAPIATIVAGQLHAWRLTRARGLDPDAPRHIRKVTRTR